MSDEVLIRVGDGMAEVFLNRPTKKNAITSAMYEALSEALNEAATSSAVRAVVIGAVGGVFTAGNDLQDFLSTPPTAGDSAVSRFLRALASQPKPVVAAVDGIAVGVGTTLLLHCDLVVASARSTFRTPFVDLGLVPEAASSLLLPTLVGRHRAAELLLLGDTIDGETAKAWGLVTRLVEPGEVLSTARELAMRLAAKPPTSVAITKKLMRDGPPDVAGRMAVEGAHFAEQLRSPEARDAFTAFLSRKPAPKGDAR